MAPFHPLRYETRAFVARALTAFAVFSAIAFVLLAGLGGQIASAEAKKDKGAAQGTGIVLQDVQNAQPQQPLAPAAPIGNGSGNGNGSDNGHGWGKGGADKADPPDPVDPRDPADPGHPDSADRPGSVAERRQR